MTDKTLYDFRNYKLYLRHLEGPGGGKGRGFRASLARATGCQSAYVSQVLNTSANFSLEQSKAISRFLDHSKDESRFFLTLVELARAGTPDLRSHFQELINELLEKHLDLKERFKVKDLLSADDQTTYFGDWLYAAAHMAITVPHLSSLSAMSEFLQQPKAKLQKILSFLTMVGLIVEDEPRRFRIGTTRMHVGRESALVSRHHLNWRLQAMNSVERDLDKDLHYTSVVSLSEADALELKARFVKQIDIYNSVVEASKEETLFCLAIDFFSLDRRMK